MATSKVSLLLDLSEMFASGKSLELGGARKGSLGFGRANIIATLGDHFILRIGHASFLSTCPLAHAYLDGDNTTAMKLGFALGSKVLLTLWLTVPL